MMIGLSDMPIINEEIVKGMSPNAMARDIAMEQPIKNNTIDVVTTESINILGRSVTPISLYQHKDRKSE